MSVKSMGFQMFISNHIILESENDREARAPRGKPDKTQREQAKQTNVTDIWQHGSYPWGMKYKC